MGGRRIAVVVTAALAALLLLVPAARASFHLISIREVYPGTAANRDADFVELQMYASGQNFVSGHALTVYNASGTAIGTFTFSAMAANGANQRTILIGDSGVLGEFGVAPDLTDSALEIPPAGGAACWAGSIDCVSWGSFESSKLPAAGTPADSATGIPEGEALRRTIEPGCPTLLEEADDSNNSAADLFDATPQPRDNASAPTETACTGPLATIDSHPANPTNQTGASFAYHSSEAGSSFECKLDTAAFAACQESGIEYAGPLADGTHAFQVRAKDAGEHVGPAANYSWRVDTTAPTATIDSHPANPSPGGSASFAYHSSETGSSFACSLAAEGASDSFSPCSSSGQTYTGLGDGSYTFKVRATDGAGNQGAASAFAWEVDNSLSDTTPPQTSILSKPPDPSESSTVSFTYESNEPGSTFECSLDATPFASCPASGITHTGLANGAHSFAVRAIDASENVDPTPAGYSFDIAVPAPPPPPAAIVPPPPLVVPLLTAAPPRTRITAKPRRHTSDRTPTVRFRSNVVGAGFQCSVDRARFKRCRSPFTARRLRPGRHRIRVRAFFGGAVDPTPAGAVFKVVGGNRRAQRRHRRYRRQHRIARRDDRRQGHRT